MAEEIIKEIKKKETKTEAPKAADNEAAPKAAKVPKKEMAAEVKVAKKEAAKAAPEAKAVNEIKPVKKEAVIKEAAAEVKISKKETAEEKPENNGPKIRVTLTKSTAGRLKKQQRTVQALGLVKIGSSREFTDGPAVRGMIHNVRHMVKVEDVK